MKSALAITHLDFENLGSLAGSLQSLGFHIEYCDAVTADLGKVDPLTPDLLIVLGGPIGVYEQDIYPFLGEEITLIRQRLDQGKATLGICLGAQLMAAALGGRVYPGTVGKEIGWAPVVPATPAGQENPLAPLFESGVNVLHWHGDTFDLPPGARLLASSSRYLHQAFAVGDYGLALQFHAEVEALGLERWYVGHACELAREKIYIPALRKEAAHYASGLAQCAEQLWSRWLAKAVAPG